MPIRCRDAAWRATSARRQALARGPLAALRRAHPFGRLAPLAECAERLRVRRIGEWLWRYLPAELCALVFAVVAASLAESMSDGNVALIALAGAWGESLAFYATMIVREIRTTPGSVVVKARDLFLEFGFAEVLDSLLIRPSLMYAAVQLVRDPQLGIVLGKLGGDVFFYIPTIAAYELRKRYLPRTRTA